MLPLVIVIWGALYLLIKLFLLKGKKLHLIRSLYISIFKCYLHFLLSSLGYFLQIACHTFRGEQLAYILLNTVLDDDIWWILIHLIVKFYLLPKDLLSLLSFLLVANIKTILSLNNVFTIKYTCNMLGVTARVKLIIQV